MLKKTLPLMVWLSGWIALAGEPAHLIRWDGISFETPVAFSAPAELGLDAVALVTPVEATPGNAAMELRLVLVPADMVEAFGGDPEEVFLIVKAEFLGTTVAGDRAERMFFGQAAAGSRQRVSIPREGAMEAYLVPLSSGAHLAVALSRYGDVPEADAEAVLAMVAATLQEVAGNDRE